MFKKLKEKLLFEKSGENIAQRYIVLNGFDGVLTVLGITVGSFSTQVDNPAVVISACVGTAVGLLASGISGAYITETSQRLRGFKELRAKMLTDMEGSVQEKNIQSESLVISLLNGFSSFMFAMLGTIPFFLATFDIIPMLNTAYYSSMFVSGILLAVLGGYLGRIARESITYYALKMVLVGVGTAALMYGLQLFVL